MIYYKIFKQRFNKSDFTVFFKDKECTIQHREDGPAIETSDGTYKAWWINNKRHREDGPAIEWSDGSKEWWINGNPHRENGAAIEYADGKKEYFLNGTSYEEEEYWAIIKFGAFV